MTEPINNSYYRSKTSDLYFNKLCNQEVSLKDIPDWLLQDACHAPGLYRVALNPERGLSGDRYEENVKILEREIEKAKQSGNNRLLEQLQEIYEAHAYWREISQQKEPEPDQVVQEKPPKKKKWDVHDWFFVIEIFFVVLAFGALCYLVLCR